MYIYILVTFLNIFELTYDLARSYRSRGYVDNFQNGLMLDLHFHEDRSPTDTWPTDTSPTDIFPTGQLPDKKPPRQRLPRLDISLLGYFLDKIFPRPYVLIKCFISNLFEIFFCLFQLVFTKL